MSSKTLLPKLPVVTVFTSISNIGPALQQTKISVARCSRDGSMSTTEEVVPLPVDIISSSEEQALGGAGGTVEFDPSKLSRETKLKLRDAEILVTEPHVLAQLMELSDGDNQDHHQHNNESNNLLKNLQWCQSTYAGVDPVFKYLNSEEKNTKTTADEDDNNTNKKEKKEIVIPPSFTLTRFAGVFGRPIAEWCVGRIIEYERGFVSLNEAQRCKQWATSSSSSSPSSYDYDPAILNYRYLCDLTLSVLGCGDIGRTIAKSAKHGFQMKTLGWMRKSSSEQHAGAAAAAAARAVDQKQGFFDQYTSDLVEAIAKSDYVVSALPSTPDTYHMLTNQLFVDALNLRKKFLEGGGSGGGKSMSAADSRPNSRPPVFINVGRGDVIRTSVLLECLDDGLLGHAILDVVEDEPLPLESPLWSHPNITISPHVSGLTRSSDVPRLIKEQYELYINMGGSGDDCNNPTTATTSTKNLKYKVDWDKGY
eukprot:CAMPEP_0113470740 /NCGR_PEP_ID=MMETSP0014_2-20120614/16606_1 /TAXON_ID=2857 /ORGANISM="Nitzschia sp." /LENGTH=479 /DNA_ID=CAMNT_0000363329 /DNA_START=270 /DNA_END=1709 /DNA_ORIENTATION=- /assembly_acc=CAM_ASM_000159